MINVKKMQDERTEFTVRKVNLLTIILLLAKYFVQKYPDFKNNLVSQNSGGCILPTQIANL